MNRFMTALALCAVPLLAQAQSCPSPNADADYILGEANGTASAMHWPTGLVWKRCLEGMAFNSTTGQCTGTPASNPWQNWATSYLPKYFADSGSDQHNAPAGRDFLTSGDWRMTYKNELISIMQSCGNSPKINRTVFPNTPSWLVWSGSPYVGYSDTAWFVDFDIGLAGNYSHNSSRHVRLVRSGQSFAALTSPAAQTGAVGTPVTFSTFTLAASTGTGQAWGGARISGAGSPEFQVNGTGDWVQEAIVKSGDAITVRLMAPATGSNTATFTLRSGQTTGTHTDGSNGGTESTVAQTTTATFTANAPRYTKIASNGAVLPDSATLGTGANDWACTRDNVNGLIWEVKTTSGLRDQNYTYTWYDSHSTDGNLGISSGTTNCATPGRCDTEKYAQDVNAIGLCGATDWRMPSKEELLGIVDAAQSNPKINPAFFPNTPASLPYFWSSSSANDQVDAWYVDFYDGYSDTTYRDDYLRVRLVRVAPPLAPVAGVCGSVAASATEPATGLCSAGTSTVVSGSSGAWRWDCNGLDGGSSTTGNACTTPYASQTLSISANPTSIVVGGTSAITASSSATGLAVTLTPSGTCSLSGSTATGTAQGTCTITASQAGTGDSGASRYLPATPASSTITVSTASLPTYSLPEGPQAGQPLSITPPTQNNWVIDSISAATLVSVGTAPPPGVSLPHGIVSLKLKSGTPGSSATVVLTYPQAFPAGTKYYKFGKTQTKPTDHWYEFSGAVISGNTVTLTLTDGGAGDNDLTANGQIDDPGGPAILAATLAQAAPIPTLGGWALMLLSGLLGLLAAGRLRRFSWSRP